MIDQVLQAYDGQDHLRVKGLYCKTL